MLIYTENSVYQVSAKGSHFEVTKVAEAGENANPAIGVGKSFASKSFEVRVGSRARFDTVTTSLVMKVIS